MIKSRFGVFETNSSSTHSISIYTDAEWKKVQRGEGYIRRWGDRNIIYTKEEVIHLIHHEKDKDFVRNSSDDTLINKILLDYGFVPSDWEDEGLECDVTEYVTSSGEKLHIVSQYGNDW